MWEGIALLRGQRTLCYCKPKLFILVVSNLLVSKSPFGERRTEQPQFALQSDDGLPFKLGLPGFGSSHRQ